MRKPVKIVLGITIGITVTVAVLIFLFIRAVLGFFGYRDPIQRFNCTLKTNSTLEKKYPGHDFDVKTEMGWGEYGGYLVITGTDEEGIDFNVQWIEDKMVDHYHDEWNIAHYGKKLVEYQNGLRDKYFPQIPYVDTYEYSKYDTFQFYRGPFEEVFFTSMEDAIEGSKSCAFNTDVTFKGIDLDTADEEELEQFAYSIADSLLWLSEETGYYDVRINDFFYRKADEYGAGFQTREELAESVIKQVMVQRKINSK